MLKNSLKNCFAAKKEFAKNSIPLLLEKLYSNVEEAQLDSLDIFTQCSRLVYDPNDYKEHVETLWSNFLKTAMNASKLELAEAALSAIEALAFSISRTVQEANLANQQLKPVLSIDTFTEKAMHACIKYLNEPDLKLVWPSVKCLHALAKASSTSNFIVIKKVIPLLLDYYNLTTFVC
jgi:DNA repair/transcription protein MET18/MMS19